MKGGNPHRNYFMGYLLKYFDDGSIYGRARLCSFEGESDNDYAFGLALNVIGQLLANIEVGFYPGFDVNIFALYHLSPAANNDSSPQPIPKRHDLEEVSREQKGVRPLVFSIQHHIAQVDGPHEGLLTEGLVERLKVAQHPNGGLPSIVSLGPQKAYPEGGIVHKTPGFAATEALRLVECRFDRDRQQSEVHLHQFLLDQSRIAFLWWQVSHAVHVLKQGGSLRSREAVQLGGHHGVRLFVSVLCCHIVILVSVDGSLSTKTKTTYIFINYHTSY